MWETEVAAPLKGADLPVGTDHLKEILFKKQALKAKR